ncbi:response regulator [Chitinibacteraceae bacterium HSL-7]
MSDLLADSHILVADDAPTVRQSIRLTLGQVGISRVDLAASIGEARRRLRNGQYDVVLCDYHFGEGTNGQELLEEMRHLGELPLTTVWFMITAEATYEKVVAVAEVGPDDYLLKPFTGALLLDRLAKAWEKKQFLKPLFEAIDTGDASKAVEIANRLLEDPKATPYKLDLCRLLGNLLIEDRQLDRAKAVFESILAQRAVPWAKLGLAKVLNRQGRKDEAEGMLKSAIGEHAHYVDAYEELAALYTAEGRLDEAMGVLEQCLSIAPTNVTRLQKAGNLASVLGDSAKAKSLLEKAVTFGGNSSVLSPETVLHLALSARREGSSSDAERYLRMLVELGRRRETFAGEVVGKLASALFSGQRTELDSVGLMISQHEFTLELAVSTIMAADLLYPPSVPNEQASDGAPPYTWLRAIAERFITSKYVSGLLEGAASPRPAWSDFMRDCGVGVDDLNRKCVQMMVTGQVAEAMTALTQAAARTHNTRLMLSASHAIVRYLTATKVERGERNTLHSMADEFIARLGGTVEEGVLYTLREELDALASKNAA